MITVLSRFYMYLYIVRIITVYENIIYMYVHVWPVIMDTGEIYQLHAYGPYTLPSFRTGFSHRQTPLATE